MNSTAAPNLQITVNGQPHALRAAHLGELVAELALDPCAVAIEHNRVIVARSAYTATRVQAGDSIEIVSFIGGG